MTIDNRAAVRQAIAEALGNAYDCTRVWSAWGYGTMGPDDFALVAEDDSRLDEITDAAIAAMNNPAAANAADQPELYFLQDKRTFVGNCPMWWAKDGNGYTTRIDQAQRYTKEKAFAQHQCRETDIPWPCSVVEPLQRPTIDMQYLYKTEYFKTMQQKVV